MSDPSKPLPLSDAWFERVTLQIVTDAKFNDADEVVGVTRAVAATTLRWAADDAERKRAGVQLGDRPGAAAIVLIRVRDQLRAKADAIEGER